MTWLDLWLRGSQHRTHQIQGAGTCWSSHAHTPHLPLKKLERMAAQAATKATTAAHIQPLFFWELLIWQAVRWMNRSSRDSCSTYPPSGWQGVPTKVDFYEVQFWQPCLVFECSFVGEEKSAFVCLVSFYCYRRDNIATIMSKVQSHKRANSRLQYINKW